MPEITQEEKIKIFERLPKELQNLMRSEDTGAFLLYLGEKYNLDDDKISSLSEIVGNIILNITPFTDLISEIISKLAVGQNIAYQIAQEINAELFAPVIVLIKGASMPAAPVAPAPAQTTPIPSEPVPAFPFVPSPKYPARPQYDEFVAGGQTLSSDQYREPVNGVPEIVDLRKTPLAANLSVLPMTDKPEPPAVGKVEPPAVNKIEPLMPMKMPMAAAPMPPRPASPLTFTKPIERPKEPVLIPRYIEADPHKTPEPMSTPKVEPPIAPKPAPPLTFTKPIEKTKESLEITEEERKPQFIFRPPGLPPTDFPHDVLDLRRDKGEF